MCLCSAACSLRSHCTALTEACPLPCCLIASYLSCSHFRPLLGFDKAKASREFGSGRSLAEHAALAAGTVKDGLAGTLGPLAPAEGEQ
eukprot:SAG22_NODE_1288_length_4868_cov_5.920109_2_plen_88_part_00